MTKEEERQAREDLLNIWRKLSGMYDQGMVRIDFTMPKSNPSYKRVRNDLIRGIVVSNTAEISRLGELMVELDLIDLYEQVSEEELANQNKGK
jgi:hypothetical protein